MIKKIFYIFIPLLFMGCSPKIFYFTKERVFENNELKLHPPIGRFYDYVDGFRDFTPISQRMYFEKLDIPGVRYKVMVEIMKHNKTERLPMKQNETEPTPGFFKSNFNWEEYFYSLLRAYAKVYKEQNTKFLKQEVTYFKRLKCIKETSSRSGGYGFGYASKDYGLECRYYTTNGEKVGLWITHSYSASISNNSPYKMAKDKNYKGKYYPIKAVEEDFKSRVKYMLDSIELKNIDIDRMKREGLYYEGKKFKPSPCLYKRFKDQNIIEDEELGECKIL